MQSGTPASLEEFAYKRSTVPQATSRLRATRRFDVFRRTLSAPYPRAQGSRNVTTAGSSLLRAIAASLFYGAADNVSMSDCRVRRPTTKG
jgi:hypothetical protein